MDTIVEGVISVKIYEFLELREGVEAFGGDVVVREFLEIEDLQTFRRVAEQSPLVIRRDPFLFAQYFAVMFFIKLADLEQGDVKRLFEMLRGKTVIVRNLIRASSIADFIEREKPESKL